MPILRRALDRHRQTIRGLRDLSFNLEPVVLRDHGLAPAVRELTQQLGLANEVQIETSVDGAEQLAEKAQAGLYQFVRDALTQAIMRGPPQRASVRIGPAAGRRHRGRDHRRRAAREAAPATSRCSPSGRASSTATSRSSRARKAAPPSVRTLPPTSRRRLTTRPLASGRRGQRTTACRSATSSSSGGRPATGSRSGTASRRRSAAEVELEDGRQRVGKVGPSPLPADARPCAYLQPPSRAPCTVPRAMTRGLSPGHVSSAHVSAAMRPSTSAAARPLA